MKYWPVATGQGRDRYACISATTSGDLLREYYAAFYDGVDGCVITYAICVRRYGDQT